jgi:hypothetical protein
VLFWIRRSLSSESQPVARKTQAHKRKINENLAVRIVQSFPRLF